MKKILFYIVILTICITHIPSQCLARDNAIKLPTPRGYVSDFANIIGTKKQHLSSVLAAIERKHSIEIAVVTLPTVKPYSIEQYAVALFEKWKIGKRGKDNGILLLVAKNDRKVRIEVGYGLEGKLNDAKCGAIIRKTIVPFFKQGSFVKGIYSGVHHISQALGFELKSLSSSHKRKKKNKSSFLSIILIIFLILLRSGMLPYLLLGSTYRRRYYWGSSVGGGGFSSGSFGGFGGGSSGGGGASGSW